MCHLTLLLCSKVWLNTARLVAGSCGTRGDPGTEYRSIMHYKLLTDEGPPFVLQSSYLAHRQVYGTKRICIKHQSCFFEGVIGLQKRCPACCWLSLSATLAPQQAIDALLPALFVNVPHARVITTPHGRYLPIMTTWTLLATTVY